MGANYGVVLANLYLFAYDLAFLTQLTDYLHQPTAEPVHLRAEARNKQAYAESLVQELSCMKRYIDDIFGVDSPTIFKLGTFAHHKPDCFGFHGLYPPFLALELTGQGTSVDFLDVTISCSCLTAWDSTSSTERPTTSAQNFLISNAHLPRLVFESLATRILAATLSAAQNSVSLPASLNAITASSLTLLILLWKSLYCFIS